MATRAECIDRVRRLDWSFGLRLLWWAIRERATPSWESGKALEYFVLRAFELEGAEVQWPYEVTLLDEHRVEQIDGAIYCNGLACLVECKDQEENVSVGPISKLRGQLTRRPGGVVGAVFSTFGFTPSARVLAHFTAPQSILLWSGEDIRYALEKRLFRATLMAKYRAFVERGVPDHSLWQEDSMWTPPS